ncbi:MAG TPA: porin [Alphaproteobacteria bacterium]|nr:porin [Alphaproteobacteria bacterium]
MCRLLLAGTALATLITIASPALADDAAVLKQLELMQKRLDAQEQSITAQKAEIAKLKAQLAANKEKPAAPSSVATSKTPASPASVAELSQTVLAQQAEIDDLKIQAKQSKIKSAETPGFSMANGRPTFQTASGNFSAVLRSLVQVDSGYFMQNSSAPAGANDLNSGTNFRRARIGLSGKLFNVWEYYFLYDFGGSGVETSAISSAYLQYDAPGGIAIRAGAFPPYTSLEDSEGAADPLFLEKASAVEITRSLAGADGRMAVAVIDAQPRYLVSLAYTGSKVGQSGMFDEQQGAVGRLAFAPWVSPQSTAVIGVNGSYVFDTADATAGPNPTSTGINFQNSPELRVDDESTGGASLNLVSTGNINAETAYHWGADAGANWKSLYAEGGYYEFGADRRGVGPANSDPFFSGWYAEASWVLTGEAHRYDSSSAAFRSPQPANPVNGSLDGWGAWEVAARYSTVDLNYRKGVAGAATAAGGIRGGEQSIWTAGINWYPNNALRFLLNYQRDQIRRLSSAGAQAGQSLDAISLRLQVQL